MSTSLDLPRSSVEAPRTLTEPTPQVLGLRDTFRADASP